MKVHLRRLTLKDLYKLTSILDKDTADIAHIEWPFNRTAATQFISEYNTWGIWLNHGTLIGAIEVKEDLETAYFVKKGWHNLGIGTRAVKLCIEIFGSKQLWCVINAQNKASIKVAQKAGLRVKFID